MDKAHCFRGGYVPLLGKLPVDAFVLWLNLAIQPLFWDDYVVGN